MQRGKKEHSVAFKIRKKIRFRPELCSGTRLGDHDAPAETPWSAGEEHPSLYPIPLGTDPPSALAMRPQEFQPDLRL